jgi:hypothetical protein
MHARPIAGDRPTVLTLPDARWHMSNYIGPFSGTVDPSTKKIAQPRSGPQSIPGSSKSRDGSLRQNDGRGCIVRGGYRSLVGLISGCLGFEDRSDHMHMMSSIEAKQFYSSLRLGTFRLWYIVPKEDTAKISAPALIY